MWFSEKLPEVRVLCVGASSVGKSAVLEAILTNKFIKKQHIYTGRPPDRRSGQIECREEKSQSVHKITGYFEEYKDPEETCILPDDFEKSKDVILLIYDTTDRTPFRYIQKYIETFLSKNSDGDKSKFILVGNKTDLKSRRIIGLEMVRKYAQEHGIPFVEVSSRENTNIPDLRNLVINKGLQKKAPYEQKENPTTPTTRPSSLAQCSFFPSIATTLLSGVGLIGNLMTTAQSNSLFATICTALPALGWAFLLLASIAALIWSSSNIARASLS